MADITHGTWIKDGKAVDAVYQNNHILYGRNLYIDTRDFDNSGAWANWGNWHKTGEKFNGLAVMSTDGNWNGLGQTAQAKKGEIYTLSLYARYESGTGNSTMYFGNPTDVITNPVGASFSLNKTWQRFTGTFTVVADGLIEPRIERTTNNTNTLMISGLKLEKGNTATPYSIAPEDILN